MASPFDTSSMKTGPDGIRRYEGMPANLVTMLQRSVEIAPDREAVCELGGERVAYRQFLDRAARVAGGLRDAGVRPGDRAAIRLGNGLDWTIAFFGAQFAQAVVVPVNTRFSEDEAAYVLEDSGAKFTFLPGSSLPDGPPAVLDDATPNDIAAIFYTSGTTGFPKGAMITHENFISNAETGRRVIGMPEGEVTRTLVSVPLFHVTGCNSQFLSLVHTKGTTVVMPQFEVQAFLQAIQDERIDNLVTVPAIYWLAINQPNFADFDLSSVRYLSYGGAPIAPDLVRAIIEHFPTARVGNGFGLTETSSLATYLPHEWAATHAESVGFPVPVDDVRLVDVDDHTGVGELLVRGPNVAKGYWGKPEATEATFVDSWLHTGDLAKIDDEGLVTIVDRIKDMINRGGENVYCVEVENVLAGAPGVYEVAVIAVPDPMMGEKVGAVIVPSPGRELDVDAVIGYAKDHLAEFKVPQFVAVRSNPLPRNAGGKLLKPELRETTTWGEPVR